MRLLEAQRGFTTKPISISIIGIQPLYLLNPMSGDELNQHFRSLAPDKVALSGNNMAFCVIFNSAPVLIHIPRQIGSTYMY